MRERRKPDDRERKGEDGAAKKRRAPARRRTCRFCAEKKLTIDYKQGRALQPFLTERGKIVPRRISGNCRYHQHEIVLAIKRARIMALISFTATQQGQT